MDIQKLDYEQFYVELWDEVSQDVISNYYLDGISEDLFREITYELYHQYDKNICLSIKAMARIVERCFILFKT